MSRVCRPAWKKKTNTIAQLPSISMYSKVAAGPGAE